MTSKSVTYDEISPSEFFYRNRDLAGFSNPSRALYTATRELFENSLDACENFQISPEIYVRIQPNKRTEGTADPQSYDIKYRIMGMALILSMSLQLLEEYFMEVNLSFDNLEECLVWVELWLYFMDKLQLEPL